MADVFALDVSTGKSYCVWYRGKQYIKAFQLVHTNKRGKPIARNLLYFTVGNKIRQQHTNSNYIVDYLSFKRKMTSSKTE